MDVRRVLGAAAITGAVALGSVGSFWDREEGRERLTVSYGVAGPVDELVVDGGTGGIDVRAGDTLRVVEKQDFRGDPPRTRHSLVDGTLRLAYDCSDCGVGYEVTVPAGTAVWLNSGTGGIRLRGLAGEVRASAGVGGVEASGLTSAKVRVTADTGGVELSFAASPVSVEARAEVGGVRVSVPGGEPYAVDAGTEVGGVEVTVPRQAGAARSITARAGTGGVAVTGG
ncbi:DUF4097 family beta strand repeat-containing protein [Kitasatospora purpeofusca]|uniref:hypothetical protein n=1 Tax=Kitasatospora purpeofusca TaxID=67352 RepID=UPI002258020B|nr:hypothetical protein [Kitasatospora purpeofusca]MCX4686098.1 hypothetical protein [Kitasatospora purpeofusca]